LIGTDGTAEGVVILKGSTEAEGKDGGFGEATGNYVGMLPGGGLGIGADHADGVLRQVLGDNDGEIRRGKEECLVTEEAGDSCERHRAAVTS
jgi:hypothetical protein